MKIALDRNVTNIRDACFIVKQTLNMVAMSMERGEEVTPQTLKDAEVITGREQGLETLTVKFPDKKENDVDDDWNQLDFVHHP